MVLAKRSKCIHKIYSRCRKRGHSSCEAKPLESALVATEEAMDHYGFGACGPRGFYGGSLPHLELEAALAKALGTDAAIT